MTMTKEEEAFVNGIEYALDLAVGASEHGFTLGQILIALRSAIVKLKIAHQLKEST